MTLQARGQRCGARGSRAQRSQHSDHNERIRAHDCDDSARQSTSPHTRGANVALNCLTPTPTAWARTPTAWR